MPRHALEPRLNGCRYFLSLLRSAGSSHRSGRKVRGDGNMDSLCVGFESSYWSLGVFLVFVCRAVQKCWWNLTPAGMVYVLYMMLSRRLMRESQASD
jgi:hypothetical protein